MDYTDREFWTDKRFEEQERMLENNVKIAQRDLSECREVREARKKEGEAEKATKAA